MMIKDARQAVAYPETEVTLGADKGYDAAEFIEELQRLKVTPHVAKNKSGRRSAVPDEIAKAEGYALSQRKRELIERDGREQRQKRVGEGSNEQKLRLDRRGSPRSAHKQGDGRANGWYYSSLPEAPRRLSGVARRAAFAALGDPETRERSGPQNLPSYAAAVRRCRPEP